MHSDHYAALGVPLEASAEEVKAAYRRAALRLHPDKAAAPDAAPAEDFLRVQHAWEVLGDPDRRSEYDRQLGLLAAQAEVQVNEHVQVQEMHLSRLDPSSAECLTWPCRCGGTYCLLLEDVSDGRHSEEVLVPCNTCSLYIAVHPPDPDAPS